MQWRMKDKHATFGKDVYASLCLAAFSQKKKPLTVMVT